MNDFNLNAEARFNLGKGASRRMRRLANLVPAVVYGGNKASKSISIPTKEITKLLINHAAYSHVIELNIGGIKQTVIIKALQRHPAKDQVLHVDFVRVIADQKLTAIVLVRFIGEATIIKKGGEISHVTSEIEVSCLPKDLPEFIEVDLTNAKIGDIIHLSDLTVPRGIEFVALAHGDDKAIVNIHAPRVVTLEATEGATE
ncbi:50S ribosomal protein L25/general stress protein Ctc [Candidatus Pseudomonas adelgestsugas]|uniref:Large ribosomal subunit protein bL25 n=1 Tax=Candidatus Pseudomonas adelgestsugas TaxID=1302376 RepID=A0ABX5R8Q5_9PSED|nr:50S ribosomal protein L25/general stress protein Ctc [Candidatus Pseudomonas adelgestsugas]QAX81749.1 50S ribosomal protein L25 [Candidatus Pseudomonas adelgestsugas]